MTETVIASTEIVVLEGEAYRGARQRFHNLLLELLKEPITAGVLASQFSNFYRGLREGDRFTLQVVHEAEKLQVRFLLEHKKQACDSPLVLSRRMQLGCTSSVKSGHWVTQVIMPLRGTDRADAERCQAILNRRSSEELSHEMFSTSEVLNRVREELGIAADIQRSFLIGEHELNGLSDRLDLGALMVPSKEIGGDLYDCIALGAERYLICVGDVSGKGVPAALTMSTCLTLVRSYCEVIDSPAAIMRRVNQRLSRNNPGCAFTTLFLAVLDAHSGDLRYCNAGHNPTLLLRSSGVVERLSQVHGPALGVADEVGYGETRLTLAPEETLVIYSDGASEMFNVDHRRYGMDGMEAFFSKVTVQSSSRLIRQFMRSLRDFAGPEPQHDDITLLAVRLLPVALDQQAGPELVIAMPNRLDGLDLVKRGLEGFAERHQLSRSLLRKLQVVCDELLSNVVRHGCSDLPEEALIELRIASRDEQLHIQLQDPGRPFNPLDVPDPDLTQSIEDRPVGGLGLHLVRKMVSRCSYQRINDCNRLLLEMQV